MTPAYRRSAGELASELGTDLQHGLGDDEARRRLERDGRNELAAEPPVPAWRRFLAQFQDVLVVLLLVATAISAVLWAIERDAALPYEAIAILAVVAPQRDDGLPAGGARRGRGRRLARDVRGWRDRRARRPPAERPRGRRGRRRRHPRRRGRHDPGRRAPRRIGVAADRRSRADRRERPGGQGHRVDRRRRGARRSPQHGVQRHRRHLRARPGDRDRDRHAHGDGPHRRAAEADAGRADAAAARARSHRQAPRASSSSPSRS